MPQRGRVAGPPQAAGAEEVAGPPQAAGAKEVAGPPQAAGAEEVHAGPAISRGVALRASTKLVAGIFVGGRARRMGGLPKGLLVTASGETILSRWARMFESLDVPTVLVGRADAYPRTPELPRVADDPSAEGPLAGLLALFEHAKEGNVIAVACDMPNVSAALLERLVRAVDAAVVAPRRHGLWEPFFARYDVGAVAPVARRLALGRETALQVLLAACDPTELVLAANEANELDDWDTPRDMERRR